MDLIRLRKRINGLFKLSGINLRGDDCNYLVEQMSPLNEAECESWLINIVENLKNQRPLKVQIDRAALELAINDLHHVGLDEREPVFSVINAFQIPHFNYNAGCKMLKREDAPTRCMLANVQMKAMYLRQRYMMLLQKTQRHDLFAPKIIEHGVSEESNAKKYKLLYMENLLSSSHKKDGVVLGYLTQLKTGKFYLCDLTGYVELNLQNTRFHSGFFCEGCFVLAEGQFRDKVLHVSGLGFPPEELAKSSRKFIGQVNTWGGTSQILLKNSKRLAELEYMNNEASIVFLSDVRLDATDVKSKLRQLFLGYEFCPPVAIVLMGPFMENSRDPYTLQQHLTELGKLAEYCNQLRRETYLVLVPASDDPIAPNILPRPALPKALAEGLLQLWPRTILATNPCRLQYCTQQITVCRYDIMAKFCRNTLHFPTDSKQLENHLARTIICQGHLVPLNALVAPVHWDFDDALWLYPLPDLVVIGDSCRGYQTTQHNCTVMNPGSFTKSKFVFKVYLPFSRTVEDSQVTEAASEE